MSDWLGLAVILLLVLLALVGAARLGTTPKRISVEEFEKRARTGGHTRAGLFALQRLLHPKQADAIAVQQDLMAGYYNKKRLPGDGDEPDEGAGKEAANESEESDA